MFDNRRLLEEGMPQSPRSPTTFPYASRCRLTGASTSSYFRMPGNPSCRRCRGVAGTHDRRSAMLRSCAGPSLIAANGTINSTTARYCVRSLWCWTIRSGTRSQAWPRSSLRKRLQPRASCWIELTCTVIWDCRRSAARLAANSFTVATLAKSPGRAIRFPLDHRGMADF